VNIMTSQFLLMRHAKSDWSSACRHDFERPLNKRGHKDAARMGKWLLKNKLAPDRIICSPALRARTTAELVAGAVSIPLQDIIDFESLYDAGLNTALHVLIQAVEESDRPVIIGHNPTLDALVEYLADAPPPRSASGKLMTTAAVAVFTTGNGIDEGGCHLQQLVRPSEV